MTTPDRIVRAMVLHRFSALGASEIARAAGVAESTVRRWLPTLQQRGLVRGTAYVGEWTPTASGYALVEQAAAALPGVDRPVAS